MGAGHRRSAIPAAGRHAGGARAPRISRIGDHYELEATRMADAALARSNATAPRPRPVRHSAPSAPAGSASGVSMDSVEGRPLPAPVREAMESGFGRDLSRVRIHDAPADRQMARRYSARAFTHHGHIWLGEGQRADDLPLMAHELAHVLQQTDGSGRCTDLIQRQPEPNASYDPNAVTPAPTPSVVADNPLVQAMGQFAAIRPSTTSSGNYEGIRDGKRFEISQARYDEIRAQVQAEARKAWLYASSRAEMAIGRYQEQQKVDAHHWIVAPIVKTLGRVSDPGPVLVGYVDRARASLALAKGSLDSGDFVAAATHIGDGERAAAQASKMVLAYVDQIIDASEMTVTVLEGVKTASAVVLFLCAVAATGGAAGAGASALGLQGVGGTTTLLGISGSTATWATVIGTGAAITSEVGVGIARAADGDKVDWGEIAVHAAIQAVIARFSPGLGQRLSQSLGSAAVANPAVRAAIARVGLARVVTIGTNLLMHQGAQLFSTVVDDAVKALRGKSITWADFGNHLYARLLDPKGLFMAALAGALGGTQPEPSRQPAGPPAATTGGTTVTKSKTDNADFRSVNQAVGISKPRTKTTTPPPPPPGHKDTTAEEAFLPSNAERAAAYSKETPLADDGTPIQISPGASPKGQSFQSASMQKPSAFPRTIRADVGEARAQGVALRKGEILLESTQGTNVSGRSDFVTATRDASGKMWVIANDAKTRSSSDSSFADPTPGLRPGWHAQVKAAVDRATQSDPALGAELQAALSAGRVWVRQVNVDLSTAGQGAVSGVEPPLPVGWGALLGPRNFEEERK